MKLSTKIQEMNYSPIRKFNSYAAAASEQGKKIYKLNIGQPDIITPTVFFEAIRNFDEKVLEYGESIGNIELREGIVKYFKNVGVECTKDELIITNGGSEALLFIFLALLNEGDEALMAEPFYSNYHSLIKAAGGSIAPIPTIAEEGYAYASKEKLEAALTDKTKVMCVVNPSNPTGTLLTEEEVRTVIDFAIEHDLWLVVDEVYREFIYDGQEMSSFAHYPEIEDRLIVVDSISKRFASCGARIGYIMTKNEELHGNIMKLAQSKLCCPTLEQVGAAALYGLEANYFDETREEYKRRRDAICEELSKIEGAVFRKPGGAFYVMVKLPVDNAEDFLMFLLTEFDVDGETIMYAPASGFYQTEGCGINEVRLAYVLKEEDLRRAMQILKLGIEAYNKKKANK